MVYKIKLPGGKGRVVACDTETSGLYPDEGARVSAISVAYRSPNTDQLVAEAYPFDHGRNVRPGQLDMFEQDVNLPQEEWTRLLDWLSEQKIVMQQAYFDCQMLWAGHRVWGDGVDLQEQVVWDTKLASWILDPQENTSLKPTAARLWGEDEADEQAALEPYLSKNGRRFDLVPWDVMKPYSAKDAELTLRIAEYQWARLEDEDQHLWPFINLEMDVMHTLIRMNYRGIGYDVERSKVEASRARAMLAKIDRELPFRPPTPARARTWFFKEQGALPHCMTDKGNEPSVSECCVRSLVLQQAPGADLYATRQKIANAISKYYDGYADMCGPDQRLRTDYNQVGTSTMRFTSRRVNLQAIPQDYRLERVEGIATPRQLFRPADGHQLWEFDLAQAEARVAAQKAGCQIWLDAFAEGRDLHAETAQRLFGKVDKERRQLAKRANFALIYQVGPATFQRDIEKQIGLKLLDSEAKEIVYGWRELYPEFPKVNKRAERQATVHRHVVLADGRVRWFGPFDELHKAFNAYVQGSIAQFVKRWMVEVDEYGADVLLQIHDSIVCEIPTHLVGPMVDAIVSRGSEAATRFFGVPMLAEASQWMTLADEANTVLA